METVNRPNGDVEVWHSLRNSQLASVAGYTKYGIHRQILCQQMFHTWAISPTIQTGLSKYYILKWKPEHLTKKILNGMLFHQGMHYYVMFHGCSVADIEARESVSISFRVAQPEYKLANIALVSAQ